MNTQMSGDASRPVPVFRPQAFEVATIEEAMRVTVTTEGEATSKERWEKETPFLVNDISKWLPIDSNSCVLDYGCGVGRISKGLIDKLGCRVIGVDASQSMRLLAPEYVVSERFTVWSPQVLQKLAGKGFRADFAISLWVIQHVLDPVQVIQAINMALRPGGLVYALNQTHRCVPTDRGWVNDGFDVCSGLRQVFKEEEFHSIPQSATSPRVAAISMIQILRKPAV
jgi:SAM-dependent methyltransferase